MKYKYLEIQEFFQDYIEDQDKEWVEENLDDLHYHVFNTDYYIVGRHQATKWLGDQVFNIINIIKEYEMMHFGGVSTDFSDPEKIVNMYVYIVGEDIVSDFVNRV